MLAPRDCWSESRVDQAHAPSRGPWGRDPHHRDRSSGKTGKASLGGLTERGAHLRRIGRVPRSREATTYPLEFADDVVRRRARTTASAAAVLARQRGCQAVAAAACLLDHRRGVAAAVPSDHAESSRHSFDASFSIRSVYPRPSFAPSCALANDEDAGRRGPAQTTRRAMASESVGTDTTRTARSAVRPL